jgi:hypothetical protein
LVKNQISKVKIFTISKRVNNFSNSILALNIVDETLNYAQNIDLWNVDDRNVVYAGARYKPCFHQIRISIVVYEVYRQTSTLRFECLDEYLRDCSNHRIVQSFPNMREYIRNRPVDVSFSKGSCRCFGTGMNP